MAKRENKRTAKLSGASAVVAGLKSWPASTKVASVKATKRPQHT